MNYSILLVTVAPVILAVVIVISRQQSRSDQLDRNTGNSLVVLSGTLAALAILIPLGSTFLPNGKFGWQAWLLGGALIGAILCVFLTVYSMIQLQTKDKFKPSEFLNVPSSINATWIIMGLLSLTIVTTKFWPSHGQASNDSSNPVTRFTIAHDLPELGTSQTVIKQQWGMPAEERSSELVYRTKTGFMSFCLDAQGMTQSIVESKEAAVHANKSYCGAN